MAQLTNTDFTWIKRWVLASQHRNTLLTSGLSKQQFFDALQAIEDYSVGSYSVTPTETLRTTINTATGTTPTTAQNQALWYAWAAWRGKENA